MTPARLTGLAVAAAALASPLAAQSWRLRLDASAQRVSFRGVTADSVPESAVTPGSGGGPVTADGYAAWCVGDGWCRFYRPGDVLKGVPASASADLTLWGLGIPGLSVRVSSRTLTDFTGDRLWPGTSPAMRLVEGYAEYLRGNLTVRAGRMIEQSRLGSAGTGGLDGARATLRLNRWGAEVGAYGGWGLARGTLLPVTSPAVNPLAEYQPGNRQVVAGLLAGVRLGPLDAQAEYRREVDPETDYFVSERAALSAQARPFPSLRVTAGADYDLAQGRWGTVEGTIAWTGNRLWLTAGARHYRPFFDLWTVWGVFSPVPYNGVNGSVTAEPLRNLRLRARAEWFKYEGTETETPLVDVEDRGWRWGTSASWTPKPAWRLEAQAHGEFGPGASSRGLDGGVTWMPREELDLSLRGGRLERPLELRFQETDLSWLGGSADWRAGGRWSLGVSLDRYWESRTRPDAGGIDWNQWRASARVSLTLRSSADRWQLPPARPREVVR